MLQRQLHNQYQRRKRWLAVPTMVADVYVDINATGANDGTSWKNAYTNLQVAITESPVNGLIAVNDGVYSPIITNNKRITIQSVNGAAVTIIDGDGTARCATMATSASHTNTVLNGFTLTNGYDFDMGGGSYAGTLNNCTLSGNTADRGGGSYGGTLNNCTLSGNTADRGGGSYGGTLNNCTLSGNEARQGGGSYNSTLNNCILTGNTADLDGGGSYSGTLNNCTLSENMAGTYGGGSSVGTLNNCILTGNQANYGGGSNAGTLINCTLIHNTSIRGPCGANNTTLINCIMWDNTREGTPYNHGGGTINYCNTLPLPAAGDGNISEDPLFVDAANNDFRLQPSSPCIDAGSNDYVTTATDLDGNPRIVGDTVDMGAYEFQG